MYVYFILVSLGMNVNALLELKKIVLNPDFDLIIGKRMHQG
jgi:hypothetical protein